MMCDLREKLREESKRHGWGLLLIAKDQLHNIITTQKPSTLLEIGCHNKLLGKTLRKWGFQGEYIGLDVCKYDVKIDVMASGDHLPFRSNSFDMVVMIETLEHIPNYVECLKRCGNVIRPNGLLFIQSIICYDRCAYEGDDTHLHTLHPNCLKRLMRFIGLKVVEEGLIGSNFYIVFNGDQNDPFHHPRCATVSHLFCLHTCTHKGDSVVYKNGGGGVGEKV